MMLIVIEKILLCSHINNDLYIEYYLINSFEFPWNLTRGDIV